MYLLIAVKDVSHRLDATFFCSGYFYVFCGALKVMDGNLLNTLTCFNLFFFSFSHLYSCTQLKTTHSFNRLHMCDLMWTRSIETNHLDSSCNVCVCVCVSLLADTIPVSSSTDWQAAFGFGSSSKQQDDDLGFDPFDVTRKALADLIEKELSVQDQSPFSPGLLSHGGNNHGLGLPPFNPNAGTPHHFPSSMPRLPPLHHRAIYSSFSFPGSQNSPASQQQQQQQAARHPWMGVPTRNNLTHLNHSASAASHSNFLDLNLPPQHNTGLGGIPISGTRHLGCLSLPCVSGRMLKRRSDVFVMSSVLLSLHPVGCSSAADH